MGDFLRAIPAAATSPYALFAYALAVISFIFAGSRIALVRQVRHLFEPGSTDEQRAQIIAQVTGEPIPANISADKWLAHKRQQGGMGIALAAMIIVGVIAVVSIVKAGDRTSTPVLPLTVHVHVRTGANDIVRTGEVTLELLDSRTKRVDADGNVVFEEIDQSYGPKAVEVRYHGSGYKNVNEEKRLADGVITIVTEELVPPPIPQDAYVPMDVPTDTPVDAHVHPHDARRPDASLPDAAVQAHIFTLADLLGEWSFTRDDRHSDSVYRKNGTMTSHSYDAKNDSRCGGDYELIQTSDGGAFVRGGEKGQGNCRPWSWRVLWRNGRWEGETGDLLFIKST